MARQLGDETVILNLESGIYFGLDSVGANIWKLFEKGCTLSDVINEMMEMYDVEPKQIKKDLESLVDNLQASGLLEIS
ncbi:PqqD family protein [Thermodesulfobacteriota bacterium]